jgi:hypothetical protein
MGSIPYAHISQVMYTCYSFVPIKDVDTMLTITERKLPKSGLIVIRVTNAQGKCIAVHTSMKRAYIDKMMSRYARMNKVTHTYL